MPSLDRALALAEVHDVALGVGHDLDLDVPRTVHVLLDVDVGHPEGGLGLGLRVLEGLGQLGRAPDDAHTPSAPARRGLEDHGEADVAGRAHRLLLVLDHSRRAGDHGYPRLHHGLLGPALVPHEPDRLGPGADELDVAGLADLGEIARLGEEAVAGVDGVGPRDLRRADDGGDVQVGVDVARGTDAHRLVGEAHVELVGVGLGVDGHRLDAELLAGPQHPQGDLAAVRDQDLLEQA